jgi:hypothetical protein
MAICDQLQAVRKDTATPTTTPSEIAPPPSTNMWEVSMEGSHNTPPPRGDWCLWGEAYGKSYVVTCKKQVCHVFTCCCITTETCGIVLLRVAYQCSQHVGGFHRRLPQVLSAHWTWCCRGLNAGLDSVEYRKIPCSCRSSNLGLPAHSLWVHWMSCSSVKIKMFIMYVCILSHIATSLSLFFPSFVRLIDVFNTLLVY